MAITAETRQDIMELAVAANNAAPGTTLLSELVAMSTSGKSLLEIADSLASSASFVATYPTFQTATEFATEFLGNLVPEASADAVAEGVTIIEGMLAAGDSRGKVILEAASYLAALDESNASFGTSAALFNHRVEVATYHTITSEAAAPWAIPASVTSSDDSVATGKGAVDTALTPVVAAPENQQFILLSTLDRVTGGAGDDSIGGGVGTIDSDQINGGDGADSLSVTLSNADDNNAAFTMSNVETFQARTTGNVTLDMGNVTGVDTLIASRLGGNLTLNDVQEISNITIDRNTQNADITVDYEATIDSGTTDEITVTVTNSSNVGTVNVDGVETVNLVSNDNPLNDTNEIQIDAAGTSTATEVLNISGAGDTTVAATDALTINNSASGDVALTPTAATTITHSGTGSLTFTLAAVDATVTGSSTGVLDVTANGANDLTITGGSGNDAIDMIATLETDDSVDGGDGTDTLTILGDGVTSAADGDITVTNVEVLEIESDTNGDNLDFDVFSAPAFDSVIVTSLADADQVTLTDTQSTAFTIRNAKTGTTADLLGAVTIDLKDSSGTSTAISVDIDNRQAGTTNNQNDFTLGTLTAAGVETLTINTSKVSSAGTAEDITITTLTTAALSTLNINGDADFVVTNALSTTTDVIDASGSSGVVSVTVAGSDVTYTGGSGADTIAFGTSFDGDDSVDGGDGTDTVTLTLNAGTTTPANISNVEVFGVTFAGGAMNASSLTALEKITVSEASAAAVISQIASTVTEVNQRGGGSAALNVNYASGSAATATYSNTGATENVANSATSFSNVANLTVTAGDGTATDRTTDLGSLNGGTALTDLTVNTAGDTGDTLDTGNITGANLENLTITADEANLTVGTFASAGELKTLTISNLDAESDGNITIGAIGATSAADELTSVSIVTSGNALTGTTVLDMDDIDAAGATFSFTVDLKGTYGSSDIDRVSAKDITSIDITTDGNGTSLAIEDFLLTGSVTGDVTITSNDAFDGLTNFIDTGATGSVGNVTLISKGAMTIADGATEVFINDALTVGDITLTVSAAAGSIDLGEIEEATTVGNIDITGTGNVTFGGAPSATSIGNLTASAASGKTVDIDADGSLGTTNGVMGTTTVTGAGTFNLTVGAVTTLGNIDLSGMTSTSTSSITLNNSTTIGVVYTGGAGGDTITGTGGGDVITVGEGTDTIIGGDGADTIILTETTAAQDTIKLTDDDAIDSISGWSATDIIQLDVGDLNTELGQNLLDSSNDVANNDAAVVHTISDGDTDAAGAVAATANVFYFDDTTGINAFSDLTFSLTLDANAGNAADAIVVVFYDADDSAAKVGLAVDAGAAADANYANASTTFTELASIDMTTTQYAALAAANFAFPA